MVSTNITKTEIKAKVLNIITQKKIQDIKQRSHKKVKVKMSSFSPMSSLSMGSLSPLKKRAVMNLQSISKSSMSLLISTVSLSMSSMSLLLSSMWLQ